jgi:hypothetical protein
MLNLLKKLAKLAVISMVVSVVGLYVLIWGLSPYAANYFLSQYLDAQQLELDAESTIRYNPFLSKLTIKALTVTKATDKSEKVLALSNLTVELAVHRILLDKITISKFIIDGLYVAVNKEANALSIAGINIPVADTVTDAVVTEKEDSRQSSDFPFQLVMSKMTLKNSMIDIVEEGQQHLLQLNDLNINDVKATQALQSLSLTLDSDLDGAEIKVSVIADMQGSLGEVNIETKLTDIDINKFSHLATPNIETVEGLISYNAEHKIKLTSEGISIDITDLTFNSQNLAANKNGLQLSLGEQELKSKHLSVLTSADASLNIMADGELLLADFNIYNKTKAQVLVAMKEMSLTDIDLSSHDGQHKIIVSNIAILDSFFSDNIENEVPALTQFSSLNIKDSELTNKSIVINTIELAGLKASAQMDENKVVKNLIISMEEISDALTAGEGSNEAETEKVIATENMADEPNFAIKLNSFNLADNAGIQFSDASVSPIYNRYITVTHLSAGPFDNQLPNQHSMIKIKGTSNKYASFDMMVDAKPFLGLPNYQLKGQFNEIDLPGLSSYIKPALGYEINSGHLDLGIEVEFSGTEMDGEAEVLLRGIDLTALNDHEEEGGSSIQTFIPFNTALGMLEDSDGNVELDLPLSGDINGPSFGLSGFLTLLVKQATIIGAREYLAVTVFPYAGLVTVVIVADKHMLKVQINDLDYASSKTEVPRNNEMFLSNFAALMKDKSDLQVRLCGVSSATDIGKEKGSDISSKEDAKALRAISRQRAKNFKAYMVDEKEISSSRLLLCKPQIDSSEDAIPHLRFET